MVEAGRAIIRARLDAAFARIAVRDGEIRAWSALDEEGAKRQGESVALETPLAGLTLGVKDTIDLAGLPCESGCAALEGRVAFMDAALVAQLKACGAIALGKTRTAELAFLSAPITRNPHDLSRSPGGSSSGSAAAVADGHVDAALGTQTAGSILRPAAFCGVVGFKPSHGRFSLAGCLPTAPSLDTIGWLTRDVALAARIFTALTGEPVKAAAKPTKFLHSPHWLRSEEAVRQQVVAAAALAGARTGGPNACAGTDPAISREVDDIHARIMGYEFFSELAAFRLQYKKKLTVSLQEYFASDAIAYPDYRAACQARDAFDLEALFADGDLLLMPATLGEAVVYGETGDPAFNRFATLFGLPAITIPSGKGAAGLPIAVQLVARKGEDARLLGAALELEQHLKAEDGRD